MVQDAGLGCGRRELLLQFFLCVMNPIKIRERFLAQKTTIPSINKNFSGWHKSRTDYAVWVIRLSSDDLLSRLKLAQDHLQSFLLPHYQREPHITLGICGFLNSDKINEDDYTLNDFRRHLAALNALNLKSFEVEIGLLNSFALAPFYHVHTADDVLPMLHQHLNVIESGSDFHYVPHVTVGLYREQFATALLDEQLSAFSELPHLRLPVTQISLMTYQASEIGGELIPIVDFDLAHHSLGWHDIPSAWKGCDTLP